MIETLFIFGLCCIVWSLYLLWRNSQGALATPGLAPAVRERSEAVMDAHTLFEQNKDIFQSVDEAARILRSIEADSIQPYSAAPPTPVSVNVNDYVWVELNRHGRKALNNPSKKRYLRYQLWRLMAECQGVWGGPALFKNNLIYFQDPEAGQFPSSEETPAQCVGARPEAACD